MRTIHYNMCREDIISRVCGLFAYMEVDKESNIPSLHKATESESGCYGKYVANIIMPFDVTVVMGGMNDVLIMRKGVSYSFKEIMALYYQYRGQLGSDNDFVKLVEEGMGMKYVGGRLQSGTQKYPLAPEYINIASIPQQLKKYKEMRDQCRFYQQHRDKVHSTEWNSYMCCLCDKYEKSNGDELICVLEELVGEAETIATKFYGYADKNLSNTCFNVNVFLTQTIRDLGAVTPAIRQWVGKETYYFGDVVFYDGFTWRCIVKKTNGNFNKDTEEVEFDRENWGIQIRKQGEYSRQYMEYCEKHGYQMNFGDDYDDTQFTYEGESVLMSLRQKNNYTNVNGRLETPDPQRDWLWYYRLGVIFNEEKGIDTKGNLCVLKDKMERGRRDNGDNFQGVLDDQMISYESMTVEINYDKTGFKSFDDVEKGKHTAEEILNNPVLRKQVVNALEGINYVVGNPDKVGEDIEIINLDAYGDGLWDVIPETNVDESGKLKYNGLLRFVYYTGTHLKASFDLKGYEDNNGKVDFSTQKDTDNLMKYFFKNYALDVEGYNPITEEEQKATVYAKQMGLKYEETHTYQYKDDLDVEMPLDDISYLVKTERLAKFLRGEYDLDNGNPNDVLEDYMYYRAMRYNKFEFALSSDYVGSYTLNVDGNSVTQTYRKAKITSQIPSQRIIADAPLLRYEEWIGSTYQPNVDEGVLVERGVTAAFEKHIKFSEIKTMEDMETYANGGFFISERV